MHGGAAQEQKRWGSTSLLTVEGWCCACWGAVLYYTLLEWPLRCWSAFCISHAQRLKIFPCCQTLAIQGGTLAVRTVRYELLGRRYELAGSGQGDFVTVHVSPLLLLPLPAPASHYTGSAAHDLHPDGLAT